jgi:hypothetical protein
VGRTTFSDPTSMSNLLRLVLSGTSTAIATSALRVCQELLPSLPADVVTATVHSVLGGVTDVESFVRFLLGLAALGLAPWTNVSSGHAGGHARGDFVVARAMEIVAVSSCVTCELLRVCTDVVYMFVA